MLNFQDDYTTLVETFEDFILLTFTIIDELCRKFVPSSVSSRHNHRYSRLSDFGSSSLPSAENLQGLIRRMPSISL